METNLVCKFEDERPQETINGRLVMMASPTVNHNIVSGNVYHMFRDYLRGKPCMPFHDNTKVFLEKNERYIPDMMVVCDREKLRRKGVYGAPDLVVEVISPNTGRNDRGRKRDIYERHGVREYWIINPQDQSIEQYVLENGRFVLRDIYSAETPGEPDGDEYADDEEQSAPVTEFHPALFEDMTVRLEDVFENLIPGL